MCPKRYILDSERIAAKDAENDVAIEDGWIEDNWIDNDGGAETGVARIGWSSGGGFTGGRGSADVGAGFFIYANGLADGADTHPNHGGADWPKHSGKV
jgi:hypothetical protein